MTFTEESCNMKNCPTCNRRFKHITFTVGSLKYTKLVYTFCSNHFKHKQIIT